MIISKSKVGYFSFHSGVLQPFWPLSCWDQDIPGDTCVTRSSAAVVLTHWGRMTHICVGKLSSIGSDNGLSPGRRQAIIWTNAGILLIGLLGTNFNDILIGIQIFSIKEMQLKMSSAKWRPFCLSINELIQDKQMLVFHGRGWVGLWGFLWWAPSAKRKDHHGVSSGWSSVWHRSNTGLSSTQYEQIPIILGVWPFCLTPFFFRSITFWRAYG